MHIVVIPSWYPHYEGAISGSFFLEQAEALAKSGLKISVAYVETRSITRLFSDILKRSRKPGFSYVEKEAIREYRFRIYNTLLKIPYGREYLIYRKLKRLISKIESSEGDIDLYHLHSYRSHGYAISKIASKTGIPLVMTEHNSNFSRNRVKPYQKKIVSRLLEQSSRIIAVGPGLRDSLKEYTDKDILIIPNMVDLSSFQVKKLSTSKKFQFISIGQLKRLKGADIVVDAFIELHKKHPEAELLIVGEGEMEKKLHDRVVEHGLEDAVTFHGGAEREEIPGLMADSHAFVLASRHETFGVVLIEAMASGKPVITSANPGPASIVTKETGFVVPIEDVLATAEAMGKMIEQYDLFKPEQIRKYCEDKYSKQTVIASLNALYRDIIASPENREP